MNIPITPALLDLRLGRVTLTRETDDIQRAVSVHVVVNKVDQDFGNIRIVVRLRCELSFLVCGAQVMAVDAHGPLRDWLGGEAELRIWNSVST